MAFHALIRPEIADITGSDIPDAASRITKRRRRTQAMAKRYAFHADGIK